MVGKARVAVRRGSEVGKVKNGEGGKVVEYGRFLEKERLVGRGGWWVVGRGEWWGE